MMSSGLTTGQVRRQQKQDFYARNPFNPEAGGYDGTFYRGGTGGATSRGSSGGSYDSYNARPTVDPRAADDNAWRDKQLAYQREALALEKMLGLGAQNIRQQEVNNQMQLGQRQMTIQEAADQFQRIMAGISEASLPSGSRATPQYGIF